VTCTIEDDGAGFDVARVLGDPTRLSLGLRGVRARSRQFDGEVRISSAAGRGTRVEAVLRDTHRSDESDVVARRGRT
jgi:signal transduction histidine kinase